MSKRALIIGISGQDGAYLSRLLLGKGYDVHGTSRDHEMTPFTNLFELGIKDRVSLRSMSATDFRSVITTLQAVEPDEIYNLAGQSSVGLSFSYPVETFESIAVGTINILECLRLFKNPARFYSAGSSECFGNTDFPASEETPFRPRSPYAAAKAAAQYAIANYREAYGMFACTGILFNHESPFRPHRFVTRKIVASAVRIANGSGEKLRLGNLDIHRDWGWAPDYVDAMWRMLQFIRAEDFVVATSETHSLREFVGAVFSALGLRAADHVEYDAGLLRPSDIARSVGDPGKASELLGWSATTRFPEMIAGLVEAERSKLGREMNKDSQFSGRGDKMGTRRQPEQPK